MIFEEFFFCHARKNTQEAPATGQEGAGQAGQGKGKAALKAKRGANNPTTEQVLKCLKGMGSSALQTGTLSKDDCYAVAMKFECSPRVVKDRFDKRGSPRKKRGCPRPNIGELADKLTEATAGNPVIECNLADIAHMVKMKPRTYRRYHDEVMLELMLRNAPAKGTWGRTVLLLKFLMQLIDGTTDSMYISAFYFSHMEIARRIVAAKDKRSLRVVIYADKKTMWNEDCHDVYAYLLENNVEVYVSLDSAMEHSKMWILDGRIIIEGSFNISVAALGVKEDRKPKNNESCTVTTDRALAKANVKSIEAACRAGKQVKVVKPVQGGFTTSRD